MDKIARIRQEIERLKGICTAQIKANPGQTFPFVMEMTGYDKLLSFLDTLSEESDKSLEEAAEEYIKKGRYLPEAFYVRPAFIAGANWQKTQMMKEAVDAEVLYFGETQGVSRTIKIPRMQEWLKPFKDGDKVRIIIIKEKEENK